MKMATTISPRTSFASKAPATTSATDVLLFVNGIPIVNLEAKTTGRDLKVDDRGAKQCGTVQPGSPAALLLECVMRCVNEYVFKYGIPVAKFSPPGTSADASPHNHIPATGPDEMSVYGLLDRGTA